MPEFKDMLRFLRTRENLSQADLSRLTGIGRGAISMYEAGKREPDFETAEVFADFFNVNMDVLIGREDRDYPSDALDAELVWRLLQLTPEELARVDAFVQGILATH